MAEREQELEWVERMAMFCAEEYGVPPIAGRILGWLMICDPPEQSAGQIATAIGASKASLATNMRMLTDAKFVRRRTRPGERTNYYRVDDDAWETVIRRRMAGLAEFRDLAADGIDLAGPGSARAERLRVAYEAYAWIIKLFAEVPRFSTRRER
ncbi:siderophore transport transcriptional regulator MmpR5 [Actinoallomurus vinaceus]|uniref:Siderophore transport transcriptional regulator MmpR5 n=1 Tax=Actinoallomurus vinaceus TaxID=1080074 RepID=A0ABP8UAI2_9ACTN